MGGISVDQHARSSLPGLWAIGECSSTGAHGANRLASNSLLEAIVFGARAAADINAQVSRGAQPRAPVLPPESPNIEVQPSLAGLKRIMTTNVGLERNAQDLRRALDFILKLENAAAHDPDLRNMAATCLLVAGAALLRTESRGGHFRSDYPATRPDWNHRTFLTLDQVRRSLDVQENLKPAPNQSATGFA
jgi:L-aspartate oxidase